MQRILYGEILEDDQQLARERERMALDQSILLLEQAGAKGASSVQAAEAIAFTSKLWTVLVEDLANPENGLPKELRAQIVSIGIWILRDLEQARTDENHNFSDVVAVSKAIRDGLT
jgi:flagellar biosynthesis activator protein FlaF